MADVENPTIEERPKKPRSEAQKRQFEQAKAKRMANIKVIDEKKQQKNIEKRLDRLEKKKAELASKLPAKKEETSPPQPVERSVQRDRRSSETKKKPSKPKKAIVVEESESESSDSDASVVIIRRKPPREPKPKISYKRPVAIQEKYIPPPPQDDIMFA